MERTYEPFELGGRMRYRREKLKYTQEKLAEKTGISAQYIYRLENGKSKSPGIEKLIDISNALRVPLEWLVFGEE